MVWVIQILLHLLQQTPILKQVQAQPKYSKVWPIPMTLLLRQIIVHKEVKQ
jgi:hypothetical protein